MPNEATAVPTEESANTAPEGVNWAELATEVDVDGEGYVLEPLGADSDTGASTEPSGADVPVAAPAIEPATGTPPPAQPAQAPAQTTQQPPQPVAAQPPVEPLPSQQPDPMELQARFVQDLQARYSISQEDAIALQTAPETVIPRMAAYMHMQVMQNVMAEINRAMGFVPQMLQSHFSMQEAETSAKQEFFGAWPGLSGQYDAVVRNAALYRQANPQATRQQVIEGAGMLTAMALGVDPASLRGQAQVQRTVTPLRPQGAVVPPPRPAAVGSAPAGLQPAPQDLYSAFAEEDLNWSRGE